MKLYSIRERWQWQNAMPCRFERRDRFALIFWLLFLSRKKVKKFLSKENFNCSLLICLLLPLMAMPWKVSDTLINYDDNCPDLSTTKLVNTSKTLFTENNPTTTHAIKLYPNPNDGNMVLEYSITENENAVFEIYDIAGSLIEKYLLDAQQNSFNIRSQLLSNGIYQYKFIVNNRLLDANKIVIIK